MKRKMYIPDPFETFLGPMRSQLADYVNEKRALGKDFGSEIKTLRSFDRFVVAEGYEQIGLTEDLYWRWERSNPKDIKPNTLGHLDQNDCWFHYTSKEMITRHSYLHHLGSKVLPEFLCPLYIHARRTEAAHHRM